MVVYVMLTISSNEHSKTFFNLIFVLWYCFSDFVWGVLDVDLVFLLFFFDFSYEL